MTLEIAIAKFISSMGNLVWIFGLTILTAAYLVISGFAIPASMIDGVRSVIVTSLWVIVFLRVIDVVQNSLDKYHERQKAKMGYERSRV